MADTKQSIPLGVNQNASIVLLDKQKGEYGVNIEGIGVVATFDRNTTLVLEGAGNIRIDNSVDIKPRIEINTVSPVQLSGSFRVARESNQFAVVDVTPVGLAQMNGLDVRATVASRGKPTTTSPTMNHNLSTPENGLSENPRSGVRSLTFRDAGGRSRQIEVETGAQSKAMVEARNFKDADGEGRPKRLFTHDGTDSFAVARQRHARARSAGMADVGTVLDSSKPVENFAQARENLGIPQSQLRGKVTIKPPQVVVDPRLEPVKPLPPGDGGFALHAGNAANAAPKKTADTTDYKKIAGAVVKTFEDMFKPHNPDHPEQGGRQGVIESRPWLKVALGRAESAAKEMLGKDGKPIPDKVQAFHSALQSAVGTAQEIVGHPGSSTNAREAARDVVYRLEKLEDTLNGVPGMAAPVPTPNHAATRALATVKWISEPYERGGRAGVIGFNPPLRMALARVESALGGIVDEAGKPVENQVQEFHAGVQQAIQAARETNQGRFKVAADDIIRRLEKIERDVNRVPGLQGDGKHRAPKPPELNSPFHKVDKSYLTSALKGLEGVVFADAELKPPTHSTGTTKKVVPGPTRGYDGLT